MTNLQIMQLRQRIITCERMLNNFRKYEINESYGLYQVFIYDNTGYFLEDCKSFKRLGNAKRFINKNNLILK